MMKKLLVLLILVGLTTMASAALQISVGGDPEPVDSEIWLLPSETIFLDVWTDATIDKDDADTWFNGWALVVDTTHGSIVPGMVTAKFSGDAGYTIFPNAVANGLYPGPEDGVGGTATPVDTTADPGDVLFDEIIFHCEDFIDATILLYTTQDYVTYTLNDSVIIHQPEPMTVALLGLGGLFLRRRR
jgi:hypothetical protein